MERRQDKARARGVSGVHEIPREIVENPAEDRVRHEEDNTGDIGIRTGSKP